MVQVVADSDNVRRLFVISNSRSHVAEVFEPYSSDKPRQHGSRTARSIDVRDNIELSWDRWLELCKVLLGQEKYRTTAAQSPLIAEELRSYVCHVFGVSCRTCEHPAAETLLHLGHQPTNSSGTSSACTLLAPAQLTPVLADLSRLVANV